MVALEAPETLDRAAESRNLLLLGSGPVAIPDLRGAGVALGRSGEAVLIAYVGAFHKNTPAALADELDRLARLRPGQLASLAGSDETSLVQLHTERFGSGDPRINGSQRVVLVTDAPLDERQWRTLHGEVGKQLDAVLLARGTTLEVLEPPRVVDAATTGPGAPWTMTSWVALAAVLLGVGIALIGIGRVLLADDESVQESQVIESPLRTVIADAPSQATHGHWIGQSHAVTTELGRTVFVYSDDGGLYVVMDERNRGRSWRSAIAVDDATPDSLSIDRASGDDVLVAMSDGTQVDVAVLHQGPRGWDAGKALTLDDDAAGNVVDIAWDEAAGAAHVVWASGGGEDERLEWAHVSVDGTTLEVVDSDVLARADGDLGILANVAADEAGNLMVSYRKGATTGGWYSRRGTSSQAGVTWSGEERLPVEGVVGAASLALDASGSAHLVVRNDNGPRLEYLRRSLRGGWSSPDVVTEGRTVEEVELPAISVDAGSRLVYVFFQSDADTRFPIIRVAIHDPAAGWAGPYDVADPGLLPDGAGYPSVSANTLGEPYILWTTAGAAPQVQVARVVAP